ncbi:unnamed protein product (macronuclear) [Paramecium tetraurelia]|uniref:Transmembrane protein n=1 Tax=Paramecium tetraurelia TaxID=5888 RepID=A0DPL2_PARTE|nr:uncharacterized protein GSPATT00019161001 [Paramecium tetraurelia]CAK84979.1 unnamed protein product [Paramecium tetraurelia]|eukprot:XP_001452376.1 hypothetical protein (macronuclear) [Paramecium tetraurelia strain d4-2]
MSMWITLKQKFQQLRMRNQIFLIKIFVLLISFFFIGCCYLVQQNIMLEIYEDSSKIVLHKQDRKSLMLLLPQLHYYIVSKQQSRIQLLSSISTFYSQLDQFTISSNFKNSLPCQTIDQVNFLFKIPEPCYTCFLCEGGNIIPEQVLYKDLEKLERMLTEFIFSFNTLQKNRIFFLATGNISFGYMYPQVIFNWSYQPAKVNWFTNHLELRQKNPDQKYFFSLLYFSGTAKIYKQTISYSLENRINNHLDAIAATDMDAEDWNMKSIKANTYLLNQYGEIIYRNVDLNLSVLELNFIYEENKTGFNQTDWNQIQNLARGDKVFSNCYMQQTQILCRYNSIYKEPIKIVAKIIPGNFTLMMFTNSSFEANLQNQFLIMEQNIYEQLKQGFNIQILSFLAIIFVSMIVVILMFLPILKVMLLAKLYIKRMGNNLDKEIFKIANKANNSKGIFNELQIKIINFGDIIEKSQLSKSDLCKDIEKIQYQEKFYKREQSEFLGQVHLQNLQDDTQQRIPQKAIIQFITCLFKQTSQFHHSQK